MLCERRKSNGPGLRPYYSGQAKPRCSVVPESLLRTWPVLRPKPGLCSTSRSSISIFRPVVYYALLMQDLKNVKLVHDREWLKKI